MMVIFLTGLVSMILMRTLRNDYAKYAREDDDLESLVMFPQTFMCHSCAIVFDITTLVAVSPKFISLFLRLYNH